MPDYIVNNDQLYHHGIKGQKWGVRRYQNPDGSLTPAGKKRISKEYKTINDRASKRFQSDYTKTYIDAYNKSADYMNKGGIDRFNESQRKKYGEKYTQRDGYESDYEASFNEVLVKNLNRKLNEFYNTDVDIKRARALVKQYDMTKWNDLAKANEDTIEEVRRVVEKYKD